MKNVDNEITLPYFAQSRLLVVFLTITTLLLVACGGGGGGSTTTAIDRRTSIEGTLSYADIIVAVGDGGTRDSLLQGELTGQEITYSIARTDNAPKDTAISIDPTTGKITVDTNATRSLLNSYTVSMTGTGDYKGTIEANVNIWIQAFVYNTANITSGAIVTQNPPQVPAGAIFSLREATDGLGVVDSGSGEVSINPTILRSGVYAIAITEGTEEYEVGIEVALLQPVDRSALLSHITTVINGDNTANLNYIDTSLVTDMNKLFKLNPSFNGNISKWDTSNVTNMESLFAGASGLHNNFNGDISDWDVSKVTDMSSMFSGSDVKFNGDISGWDVSNVTNMSYMFQAYKFTPDLSKWDVGKVTDMSFMFGGVFTWNPNFDINKWDVGAVVSMKGMFSASSFNKNIAGWNISSVTDMSQMFYNASAFTQDISGWNVGASVIKTNMFVGSGLVGSEPNWYSVTP